MTDPEPLPVPFCTPTCPTQQSRQLSDCECGGAAENRRRYVPPNRPTATPPANRPSHNLEGDQ